MVYVMLKSGTITMEQLAMAIRLNPKIKLKDLGGR